MNNHPHRITKSNFHYINFILIIGQIRILGAKHITKETDIKIQKKRQIKKINMFQASI